jgi:anti-anti-sigma factor
LATEHEVMLELQRAMLPADLPVLPDLGLAAEYRPADLPATAGGDWFDVVPTSANALALVVGDVVGHGATASAVMGQLRAIAAERLLSGSDLDEVLRALDAFAAGSPGARGGTVCVVIFDRDTGSVRYATRGHPPPLLVAADGTTRYLTGSTGPPLALPSNGYRLARDTVLPGDTLILYSDGAIKRPGRTMGQGMSDLSRCAAEVVVRNAAGERRLAEQICAALTDGQPDTEFREDDVSVVAATVLSALPAPLAMSVPAAADRLRELRQGLAGWLGQFRVSEDDLVALELSMVEAATNSVQHAYQGQPGLVRVDATFERDGMVRVVVTDDGRWDPPRADPGFRGRGLLMVREFTDWVRVDPSAAGTTVRLARELRRPVSTGWNTRSTVRRQERTDFEVDVRIESDGVVLSVAGAVDSSSVHRLHACLLDVSRRGSLPLTIVLDEVTLLASAGVRVLFEHAGKLLAAHWALRLVAADTSPARDVLAISGLDELVEVVPCREHVPERAVQA